MKVSIYSLSRPNKLPNNVKEYLIAKDIYFGEDSEDSVLVVESKGSILFCITDGAQLEEASFHSNLAWIPDIIEKAYKLGKEDGWDCCEYVQSLLPPPGYYDLS